jgi:hypothetical protein
MHGICFRIGQSRIGQSRYPCLTSAELSPHSAILVLTMFSLSNVNIPHVRLSLSAVEQCFSLTANQPQPAYKPNRAIMFSLPSLFKLLSSLKIFICGNIVYMLKSKPCSSIDLYGYLLDDTI